MRVNAEERQMYTVFLTGGPSRHTQWSWFVENPQGGGGGSNAGAGVSRRGALLMAVSHHTGLEEYGTPYRLVVNGKDLGIMTRGQE
jgi:hypothetical protein